MADVSFKSVQAMHETLLQKQQAVTGGNQSEFVKEVRTYIELAKKSGSVIPATRERDQVRANLRYWANYIYGIESVFPDTELAPSTVSDKRPVGNTIAFVAFILLTLLGAIQVFRSTFSSSVKPTTTPITVEPLTLTAPPTQTPGLTIPGTGVTPTSIFDTVKLVALTSPKNGDSVLPKVQFTGVSTNLEAEDSIHLLIVRGDSFFPLKEFLPQEEVSSTGEWEIDEFLYTDQKELEQSENLIVVPAICRDQQCRAALDASNPAVANGIRNNELPPQSSFKLFYESSRVLYRNAYQAILGSRLVYSMSKETPEGTSVELYTSNPDGSEEKQITFTQNISETSPSLSPDGTNILYVKSFRAETGDIINYAIAIMDSNGQNDHEITERTRNELKSPQWSYDSSFISYAMGDTSLSSSRADWTIYVYEYMNNGLGEKPIKKLGLDDNTQPDHVWLPDTNSIIFQARDQPSGTIGLNTTGLDSSEEASNFFDMAGFDEIQPHVKAVEGGYLLTFTTVTLTLEKYHNIFAVVKDSGQQAIMLTNRRGGDRDENDNLIAGADYPSPDPDSNSIYYIRNTNLYKLTFSIDEAGNIILEEGKIREAVPERYGDLVIETPPGVTILGYEIGYMEAFFPILQPPASPTPAP